MGLYWKQSLSVCAITPGIARRYADKKKCLYGNIIRPALGTGQLVVDILPLDWNCENMLIYLLWFMSPIFYHLRKFWVEELTTEDVFLWGSSRVKLASHPNWIINIMLTDFLVLLLFRFPLFDTLQSVIHYFQFVNFTHLFQPSFSPSVDPAKLECSV